MTPVCQRPTTYQLLQLLPEMRERGGAEVEALLEEIGVDVAHVRRTMSRAWSPARRRVAWFTYEGRVYHPNSQRLDDFSDWCPASGLMFAMGQTDLAMNVATYSTTAWLERGYSVDLDRRQHAWSQTTVATAEPSVPLALPFEPDDD